LKHDSFVPMAVFIGNIIKEITERRGMSKTELGRRLNMTSTNIHKIFKRESIDTGLLHKISEVLEYDFFSYYTLGKSYEGATDEPSIVAEREAEYKRSLQECQEKVKMLEKISTLQEEKIQRLEKSE